MMQRGMLWVWNRVPNAVRKALHPLSERVSRRRFRLTGPLNGYQLQGHGSLAYAAGAHEPAVCNILVNIVQPGACCVDVGAHLGYFTLLLARLAGEMGHVFAFEAHPDNAVQVRKNIEMNGLNARVTVEHFAVSDGMQKTLSLFSGRESSDYEWNIIGHSLDGQTSQASLKVSATSLDAYFPPDRRIDIIKLDIEGAEALAISGMKRILQNSRPVLMVEFHNDEGWQGAYELHEADYEFYDVNAGVWFDSLITRIYHVLAVPTEKRVGMEIKLQSRK